MTQHLHNEIDKLKAKFLELGSTVEDNLRLAVRAVTTRDMTLARQVVERDDIIDRLEVTVEEECLEILALQQPVATDLRFIVAVLKINVDLERIGDLAAHIAERTFALAAQPLRLTPDEIPQMAAKAQSMLHATLTAMINQDIEQARQVCADDVAVDALNREVFKLVEGMLARDPHHPDYPMHLVTIARHLERIADHATNIAEDVIYLARGEIVRHRGRSPA